PGSDTAPAYREVGVSRGDLALTILSTGVVQPRNRLEIKPPIAGRAEQVLVQEGQSVAKGQILAWMSSTERAALIDAARARGPEELKRWEELYRATPVLAPISGTVILRSVEPGQTFTGNDAVFVMSDRLTVNAQVDETDIAQVKLGQRATIVIDAYPDRPIEATVAQIAYDAKTVQNVTIYEIDVLPREIPPFLRSGMTASVTFHVASRPGVLLVPSAAVRQRDGRAYVLVPAGKPGAPPSEQEIRTGASGEGRVEIVSGLEEGQTVLVADVRLDSSSAGAAGGNPLMPFGQRPRSSGQSQQSRQPRQ
ncbi:MAG: efflux RND transporter periplasmic adaptor subunit, partial [Pseudomonadota bacterium]